MGSAPPAGLLESDSESDLESGSARGRVLPYIAVAAVSPFVRDGRAAPSAGRDGRATLGIPDGIPPRTSYVPANGARATLGIPDGVPPRGRATAGMLPHDSRLTGYSTYQLEY